MCLDILARYLGSAPNWSSTLANTLSEIVEFSSQAMKTIEKTNILRSSSPSIITDSSPIIVNNKVSKKNKKNLNGISSDQVLKTEKMEIITISDINAAKISYPELLKLQGSVFLSSGTLCGVVGPKALPYLGVNTYCKFYFLFFF